MSEKSKQDNYVLTQDIMIKAGTVLRISSKNKGGYLTRSCTVAIGKDFTGDFIVTVAGIEDSHGIITKII